MRKSSGLLVLAAGLWIMIEIFSAKNALALTNINDCNGLISATDCLEDYTLTTDIDCTGQTVEPFCGGYFTGTFSGDNHVISNISINCYDSECGLFKGLESGKIQNLGVNNIIVDGNTHGHFDKIGALAGFITGSGAIESSYVTGNSHVYGRYQVGGLVGKLVDGTINKSYSKANVTGYVTVGGLAGIIYNGHIRDSYVSGYPTIKGDVSVGGLVAYIETSNTTPEIKNSYSVALIDGVNFEIGSLIANSQSYVTTESFYPFDDISCMKCDNQIGSNNKTNLRNQDYLSGSLWDFTNIWEFIDGQNDNYPVLK